MKTTFTHGDLEVKMDTRLPVPVLISQKTNSIELTADDAELLRDILNAIVTIMGDYK
jgi:hypothetical protein